MPRNPDDLLSGPQYMLAVFAHPDDAEVWAGGTLALHAQHAPVHIAAPSTTRSATPRPGPVRPSSAPPFTSSPSSPRRRSGPCSLR
ncbi:hypothetical protein ACFVYP_39905 [Kitasatospora sp. NPDC058201]|uniref:hypothetical protein n=1 Tax=unclassified Kitasatospora TaxID=2633591 RepID=UPI0036699D76